MRRVEKTGVIAWIGLWAVLAACGGKAQEPAPAPEPAAVAAPVPAEAPATPATPAADPALAAAKPAVPAPAEGAAPAPAEGAAPAPAEGAAPAPAEGAAPAPAEGTAEVKPDGLVYPAKNTVIRDPQPDTPEALIALALSAAMNPDAAAGWRQFEGLLHTSEKEPNALISRRELNWPAMRRKVSLFLIEDPAKPIYKWAYAEEPGNGRLKIFVHNPKSMPTPCYVARDPEQDNQWRIQTCSL